HALSRPASFEAEAVNRALLMAETTGCSLYIVHISIEDGAASLRAAQKRGETAFGETCPHYLLLDEKKYGLPPQEAVKYVISPPLRHKRNQKALWDALADGTLGSVGTDHCPFTLQEKLAGIDDFTKIPNGVAGVEHRLSLLYTFGVKENRISPEKYVDLVSTRPAKLFGLYPRKGALAPGSDADIVLWDANAEETISAKNMKQNCDHTIYEGWKIRGKAAVVVSGGRVRYDSGELFVEPGDGVFLYRAR
ncbi:MAG: amidohydrolase family protein, partial [Actinobacteria bacterium]|nr:amidohydrolase family protein [Actinomycetota bacterium]